jgi:hypothetical protein
MEMTTRGNIERERREEYFFLFGIYLYFMEIDKSFVDLSNVSL